MIGDQQVARTQFVTLYLELYAKYAEHALRPALSLLLARGAGEKGKQQQNTQQTLDQVQGQTRLPPALTQATGQGAGRGAQRRGCGGGGFGGQLSRSMKWRAYLRSSRLIGMRIGRSAVLKSGSQAGSPQIQAPARR